MITVEEIKKANVEARSRFRRRVLEAVKANGAMTTPEIRELFPAYEPNYARAKFWNRIAALAEAGDLQRVNVDPATGVITWTLPVDQRSKENGQ